MTPAPGNNPFSDRLIEFAHFLRGEGYMIGIKEITDSLKVITGPEHPDPRLTQQGLRAIYSRNRDEWLQFDNLFNAFWYPQQAPEDAGDDKAHPSISRLQQRRSGFAGYAGTTGEETDLLDEYRSNSGAGKQRAISRADFRFLEDQQAIRQAERLAEQLALQLKSRTRLRKLIAMRGSRIDFRHTIRANMIYGGTPICPRFNIRYRENPNLVILHDVSHSMTWNNPVLFRFVRGLMKTFNECEAFIFHTQLFRVTDVYKEKSVQKMRDKLETRNKLWLGGTCIAESLDNFNKKYARGMLTKRTVFMMISDGFDTDKPEYLSRQLELVRRSCKQLLWLNPMLGREGYSPDTGTLTAARPYVDRFLPAHSIDALRDAIYTIRC